MSPWTDADRTARALGPLTALPSTQPLPTVDVDTGRLMGLSSAPRWPRLGRGPSGVERRGSRRPGLFLVPSTGSPPTLRRWGA